MKAFQLKEVLDLKNEPYNNLIVDDKDIIVLKREGEYGVFKDGICVYPNVSAEFAARALDFYLTDRQKKD